MPFRLKSAAPQLRNGSFALPALEHIADRGFTLLAAPAGYIPVNSIVRTLREQQQIPLWLRLSSEDRDPATMLVSLIGAMQYRDAGAGAETLQLMRRKPGPIAGWTLLYASLAVELAQLLGHDGVLILEDCHILEYGSATMRLLGAHILPEVPCILLAERMLSLTALPSQIITKTSDNFRITTKQAERIVDQLDGKLTSRSIRDTVAVAGGRAAVLADLCWASETLGPMLIQQLVSRCTGLDDLLSRIAKALFITMLPEQQQTLALTLHLGYAHPALMQATLGTMNMPSGPWLESLDDGWFRLTTHWHSALHTVLGARASPERATLRRAAVYLSNQQAAQPAIALFFALGDRTSAAALIAEQADELVSLGQWETFEQLLSQIPGPLLEDWPWLVYAHGEFATSQKQIKTAQQAFALASRLFSARHELQGACQSLLAESTLAFWCNDYPLAETRALAANAVAESAGMPWHQSWASWQLGCLAVANRDLDAALIYFERSVQFASVAGDACMLELPRQAQQLALHQRELQNQREFYRRAYMQVEQAELEGAEQLRLLLTTPPGQLDTLLERHHWSQLPLMLKLPVPELTNELVETIQPGNVWEKLLAMLSRLRQQPKLTTTQQYVRSQAIISPPRAHLPIWSGSPSTAEPEDLPVRLTDVVQQSTQQGSGVQQYAQAEVGAPQPIAIEVGSWSPAYTPHSAVPEDPPIMLQAWLLGPFRVSLNNGFIESWPSGRGRSILKYLLTHRKSPVPREVLMECFWPEAGPEAARNNLNVAIHGLRQTCRTRLDPQVVIFEQGAYFLNPTIQLWLDVDQFEHHIQSAQQLEATGQLVAAASAYEQGLELYVDDFLIDDLNEEWPVLYRERLRVAYIEALDRLSQISFHQGQYTTCATLCQRILDRDTCREDAHCRLMRCYSRQGQYTLALRQYQLCFKALQVQLNLEPATSTVELYEQIRQRQIV